MWTTADGQVLRVPGFRLRKWAEAVKRGCGGECACGGCLGRAVAELEGELGELIARARRVGAAVGRRSGRRMPIFSATRGQRRYRILARPLFGNQHTIVAVTPDPAALAAAAEPAAPLDVEPAAAPEEPPPAEPAPEEPASDAAEDEVSRGPLDVEINWSEKALTLEQAKKRSNWPAVYVVEANGKPVYVGQTFNVPERMEDHERDYASGRRAAGRWPKQADLKVWIGRISPKPRNVLEIVEHAVIRTLQPTPRTVLGNESPLDAIKAAGNITIRNILPPGAGYAGFSSARAAKVQGGHLKLQKSDTYELFEDVRLFA